MTKRDEHEWEPKEKPPIRTKHLVSVVLVHTTNDELLKHIGHIELSQTILEVENDEDFERQYQDWYNKIIGDGSEVQAIKVLLTRVEK